MAEAPVRLPPRQRYLLYAVTKQRDMKDTLYRSGMGDVRRPVRPRIAIWLGLMQDDARLIRLTVQNR